MEFTHFDDQGNALMVDVGIRLRQSGRQWPEAVFL